MLRIEDVAALGVDASPGEVLALFWDQGAPECGAVHPWRDDRAVARAAGRRRLAGAAPLDWPKGSTWLLQRASQPRVLARYLAPLALGGRVEIG
jgi:hypothetical protein